MEQVKYQTSILAKILYLLVGLFFVLLLVSCKDKIKPTKEFYVNDFANAWLKASKSTILRENTRLYDYTKDEDIGGTQIVFTSFLVDSLDDTRNYDRTELYRDFKIGGNDMGILVLFFYQKIDNELELILVEYELGYRMEQYITANMMNTIIDETLINPLYYSSAMQIAHYLYELLTIVYVDIYGYNSFSYDMDGYAIYLENYVPETNNGVIDIVLSLFREGNISLTTTLSFIAILLLGGSFGFIKNKGAGGSSGGAGSFRRKR